MEKNITQLSVKYQTILYIAHQKQQIVQNTLYYIYMVFIIKYGYIVTQSHKKKNNKNEKKGTSNNNFKDNRK